MKQQVMVNNKYVQKPHQLYRPVMVGSEAKKPLPTAADATASAMDAIGLSWMLADEMPFEDFMKKEEIAR